MKIEYEVITPGFEPIESNKETFPSVGAEIIVFLGKEIQSFVNLGDGSLSLMFSDEKVIVLHDTRHKYEAYQITDPDHEIIV